MRLLLATAGLEAILLRVSLGGFANGDHEAPAIR